MPVSSLFEGMEYSEFNFDGLVGPTHNYAGLSFGNLASTSHRNAVSNPKAAALQGLLKAKTLADRGFPQAILPPQERPDVSILRNWGFTGATEADLLRRASREAPGLFVAACSASSMWTANAGTMAPSCDTMDGKLHFTPANLSSNLHRAIEAAFTFRLIRTIFAGENDFSIHPPLAGGSAMSDEGAANHSRLCRNHGEIGLHLFVYGRASMAGNPVVTGRFPARQSLESSQAIARLNQLPGEQVLFLKQSSEAIDAGVFHNDVISVGHRDLFLYHEQAFEEGERDLERISNAFLGITGHPLHALKVGKHRISLVDAVQTYLFNSQLISMKEGGVLIVVPRECLENEAVSSLLSEWVDDPSNPIQEVLSFDLRESMRNGGGPACLRQRMVLSDNELHSLTGRILLTGKLYEELVNWVERHYRDHLEPGDLADPELLEESRRSLDELTRILQLPPIYPFQS